MGLATAKDGNVRIPVDTGATLARREVEREAGTPPGIFVERARLDAARRAIEDGEDHLETIAKRCGFTSSEILRRLFQRRLGRKPDRLQEALSVGALMGTKARRCCAP